jgi:hypothetical protein
MAVARYPAALLPLLLMLLAVPDLAGQGHTALVSATVVLLVASAVAVAGRRGPLVLAGFPAARGPAGDERCLHGAFRRHSNPDTPGRPGRPRAPGQGHRPA